MKAYNVHLYALVRVTVREVLAETPTEAIDEAIEAIDLTVLFDRLGEKDVAYAEDIPSALVDEVGDAQYEHSQCYDAVDWGWQPIYPLGKDGLPRIES